MPNQDELREAARDALELVGNFLAAGSSSDCCFAAVRVESSDEGTAHYVCEECGEPCDVGVGVVASPASSVDTEPSESEADLNDGRDRQVRGAGSSTEGSPDIGRGPQSGFGAAAEYATGPPSLEPSEAEVEAAAKAIYDEQGKPHGGYEDGPRKGIRTYRSFEWEELAEEDKSYIRRHARAALLAARTVRESDDG